MWQFLAYLDAMSYKIFYFKIDDLTIAAIKRLILALAIFSESESIPSDSFLLYRFLFDFIMISFDFSLFIFGLLIATHTIWILSLFSCIFV